MQITAGSRHLVLCPVCHQVNRVHGVETVACGRCGSGIKLRGQPRLQAVWALLIAAIVLYIPANVLPVMSVVSLGKETSDTLIGGVIHFIQHGAWLLAFVVFVASILVPLLKIIVLVGLMLNIQYRWCYRLKEATQLYRFIAFVGRWSMVDIFVIALLVSLVQFGEMASIMVGAATLSFAGVVLLTLLATALFDIRWLWDVCDGKGREAV